MEPRNNSLADYIATRAVDRMIGCADESVAKIAAANRIRVYVIPGMAPRYHRGDVEALAARAFRVAGEPDPVPVNQPAGV